MATPFAAGVAKYLARRVAVVAAASAVHRVRRGSTGTRSVATGAVLMAEAYVVRDGTFLVVSDTDARAAGGQYPPVALVEGEEQPEDAIRGEVRRTTGLVLPHLLPVRVWTHASEGQPLGIHASYFCRVDADDAAGHEARSMGEWVAPDVFIDRWCRPDFEVAFPAYAGWIREVRRTCEIVRDRIEGDH